MTTHLTRTTSNKTRCGLPFAGYLVGHSPTCPDCAEHERITDYLRTQRETGGYPLPASSPVIDEMLATLTRIDAM